MKRATQLLLSDDFKLKTAHGGDHARNKRKSARPFSSKRPLHLVLRSDKAKGTLSLRTPENQRLITRLLTRFAILFGIRVYEFSVNSNHIHIILKAPTRTLFQRFMRTRPGQIAQKRTGACRGKPQGAFW